jgi:hypothetical protein
VKLNARVENMPYGVIIVICTSPTPITKPEQEPILDKIKEEYAVESSLFLKYGVIVRAKSVGPPPRRSQR